MIEKKEATGNEVESTEEHLEDFSGFSKQELLKFITDFDWKENPAKSGQMLAQLRSSYDQLIDSEKEEALQKFIDDGGVEDDFDLKKTNEDRDFEQKHKKVKASISEHYAQQEKNKEGNLKVKTELLERLRNLISAEESNLSLTEFKDIQEEWKKTGHVPVAQSQELWNNYNALVDIFYNNRGIFFELKELDRKKNLETKIEICEKVEKLSELNSINQALKDLKALHEDFKQVGPVPKEDQDSLWERLKVASDKIYEKRKEYLQQQKTFQEENVVKKEAVLEKLEAFKAYESSRIDDWKVKTEELKKVQDEWNKAGSIPQDKVKEFNNRFWDACKVYYKNKNDFFKILDQKREENLAKKISLCEKVEALGNQEDVENAIREVKEIQRNFDKSGQVPIKQKDKVFARFKKACDAIFDKKRAVQAEAEKEFIGNLDLKEKLIQEVDTFISGTAAKSIDKLKEFQASWDAIGFVPRDKKKEVTDKFNASMSKFIDASTEIGEEEKNSIRLSLEVLSLKSNEEGLANLKKKEFGVQKRVKAIQTEIDQYNTNIEFFGRSKGAEKMKEEIQKNIDVLEIELKALSKELKIIKS